MKKYLLVLVTFFTLTVVHGQAQITFQKTYGNVSSGESGLSVKQISDGGFIISGSIESSPDSINVYLLKTDSTGAFLWGKIFKGSGNEFGYSTQQTSDKGFIIVGSTSSFGAGMNDVLCIKTDSNGGLLWSKTIGTSGNDQGYSVQQTTDDGFIITGYTHSDLIDSTHNHMYVYLIKIDSIGNLLWTKTYGDTLFGGQGYSAFQTTDKGFIVAGVSILGYAFLLKTDSIGTLQWIKTYGNNSSYASSVRQTNDGGFVFTGEINTTGSNPDVYLLKTDINGNIQWAKAIGGPLQSTDEGAEVRQTIDGGFVVAGSTGGSIYYPYRHIYLIKTDSVGTLLWSTMFGGGNFDYTGRSIDQAVDGGFIITGSKDRAIPNGPLVFLVKTDSNGNSCMPSTPTTQITALPPDIVTQTSKDSTAGIETNIIIPSYNYGTQFTICSSTAGVNEFDPSSNQLKIFPNPYSIQTTLQVNNFIKDATLTMYNLFGQEVKQLKNISGQSITLQRDNLPSGLYFIRLVQDNKIVATEKLVITDN